MMELDGEKILKMWEKSIDVQMHFNEIELKIRQLALTIFTGIISALGYLYKDKQHFPVDFLGLPGLSIISLIGASIIYAFFFMDKYWYHRLLKGAVMFTSNLEEKHIFNKEDNLQNNISGLCKSISENSRLEIKFFGSRNLNSTQKLTFFTQYSLIFY